MSEQMCVYIPDGLKQQVSFLAWQRRTSMSALIVDLLRKEVNKANLTVVESNLPHPNGAQVVPVITIETVRDSDD